MTGRLLPTGERALLVELDDLDAVLALDAVVTTLVAGGQPPWDAVCDRVPAARTLLLMVRSPAELPALTAAVRDTLAALDVRAATLDTVGRTPSGVADADVTTIRVTYDGPDLAEVARLTGLSDADVVAAHTSRPWRVGFSGFAPGFAYLVDGDPRLTVPRRREPRPRVTAGSVGLAGAFSGVYPRPSPGGWQLIGHTDAVLWDADRTPPALLTPGSWVRFVDGGRP